MEYWLDVAKDVLENEQKSVLLYLGLTALAKGVLASCAGGKKVLVGRVSRLMFFPVKSFGGFDVHEAEITRLGLKEQNGMFDR